MSEQPALVHHGILMCNGLWYKTVIELLNYAAYTEMTSGQILHPPAKKNT